MIDYQTIGQRIRKRRQAAGFSQEHLAELCNVGTTHISHIETGNCIPSLKVFIAILNALSCSADELLSDELMHSGHVFHSELAQLTDDCTVTELRIISETVSALKKSLRKGQ